MEFEAVVPTMFEVGVLEKQRRWMYEVVDIGEEEGVYLVSP